MGIMVLAILVSFFRDAGDEQSMPLSQLISSARSGQVQSIDVHGDTADVRMVDSAEVVEVELGYADIAQILDANDVELGEPLELEYHGSGTSGTWGWLILYVGGILVYGVALYFAARRGVVAGMREGNRRGDPQAETILK
jgi:hypothetical protein